MTEGFVSRSHTKTYTSFGESFRRELAEFDTEVKHTLWNTVIEAGSTDMGKCSRPEVVTLEYIQSGCINECDPHFCAVGTPGNICAIPYCCDTWVEKSQGSFCCYHTAIIKDKGRLRPYFVGSENYFDDQLTDWCGGCRQRHEKVWKPQMRRYFQEVSPMLKEWRERTASKEKQDQLERTRN